MKGGKQPGAGRPKTPYLLERIQYSTRLPRYIVKWLKKQRHQGRIIERDLVKNHDIEQPKL